MKASVEPAPRVCVFAPAPLLTVTIEKTPDDRGSDEVHLHAGGQGFWIARHALEGGVDVLKVSDEELVREGRASGTDAASVIEGMRSLVKDGADHVIVTRAEEPALALIDGSVLVIEPRHDLLADARCRCVAPLATASIARVRRERRPKRAVSAYMNAEPPEQ